MKETGEQKQSWETGNIENQDFDFREQGKMPGEQGNNIVGIQSKIHVSNTTVLYLNKNV